MSWLDRLFPLGETGPEIRRDVDLYSEYDGHTRGVIITYPIYRTRFRKGFYAMRLEMPDKTISIKGDHNYFYTMLSLRLELEKAGIDLCCWGAKKTVWPTGMEQDMGAGLTALDRESEDHERWGIFEKVAYTEVVTVKEQKAFIESQLTKSRK